MARKPSVNGDNLTRLTKPDSLSERIYGDLRGRLQRCEIGPEDRLVDTEIAIAYGTSRMPVREALLRLANEGYLVGTTRGFTVPRLSLDDIREIFEVRRLLEPRAAANAARDLDDATRRELTTAIQEARQAVRDDDVDQLILSNSRFRAAWLAPSATGGSPQPSRASSTTCRPYGSAPSPILSRERSSRTGSKGCTMPSCAATPSWRRSAWRPSWLPPNRPSSA